MNWLSKKIALFLLIIFLCASNSIFADTCSSSINIIQKPILFNTERIRLTQAYREQHYGIQSNLITFTPRIIVLHWTAFNTFQKSYSRLYPTKLFNRPDLISESPLNVSAHYLVDRDGTIYQLMPNNWMARHVIGLNNSAIGIENVGGGNDVENLTEAQIIANIKLIQMLVCEYPTIHYLIGHYEYQNFRGSTFWQERDKSYYTSKVDPGPYFMRMVRAGVRYLGLKLLSEP